MYTGTEMRMLSRLTFVTLLLSVTLFLPTSSKVCPPRKYGSNCQLSCSTNCKNQLCHSVDGICNGCPPGYSGAHCDIACPATYYGENCVKRCSLNCVDRHCDSIYGICHQCPPGKSGNLCDKACPPRKYGPDCERTCSTRCKDRLCHPIYGICGRCAPGYFGDTCDNLCKSGTYGQDCTKKCDGRCVKDKKPGSSLCDPISGSCDYGCPNGDCFPWKTTRKEHVSGAKAAGAIAGSLLAVLFVIVVIFVCVYKKRQASRNDGQANRSDGVVVRSDGQVNQSDGQVNRSYPQIDFIGADFNLAEKPEVPPYSYLPRKHARTVTLK